jgi:hypothetical protein
VRDECKSFLQKVVALLQNLTIFACQITIINPTNGYDYEKKIFTQISCPVGAIDVCAHGTGL